MAALDMVDAYTLADLAMRMNGKELLDIAKTLSEINPLMDIMYFQEANQAFAHKGLRELSRPTGTWTELNNGIDAEADVTEPFIEDIGLLESRSVVDKRLAALSGNEAKYRAQRDASHLAGMLSNLGNKFFYGNRATDNSFDGLATRYSDTTFANFIDGSGSGGDESSIWVIQPGPMKITFVYPKSHQAAGITSEDLGSQIVTGKNSKAMRAWVTWHQIHLGLAIYDHRCVQRVANIETSGTTNIVDPDDVIDALVRMPEMARTENTYILMNRTLFAQFKKNVKDRVNVNFSAENPYGGTRRQITFDGIPIIVTDSIVNTENA